MLLLLLLFSQNDLLLSPTKLFLKYVRVLPANRLLCLTVYCDTFGGSSELEQLYSLVFSRGLGFAKIMSNWLVKCSRSVEESRFKSQEACKVSSLERFGKIAKKRKFIFFLRIASGFNFRGKCE